MAWQILVWQEGQHAEPDWAKDEGHADVGHPGEGSQMPPICKTCCERVTIICGGLAVRGGTAHAKPHNSLDLPFADPSKLACRAACLAIRVDGRLVNLASNWAAGCRGT